MLAIYLNSIVCLSRKIIPLGRQFNATSLARNEEAFRRKMGKLNGKVILKTDH